MPRPLGSKNRRPAGGRNTEARSVTLTRAEWQELEAVAEDGSANREAARRIRASLEQKETIMPTIPRAKNIIPVASERYDDPGWGSVQLTNGVFIRLVGDGTGHGDDGKTYIAVSREVAEDEFELVGYADINDTEEM